jgi:hypothetical protein
MECTLAALTFPPAFWKILLFPANIKNCKMQIAKLILQLLLLFLIVWYCNCCCFFIVNDNVIEDRYTFFSKLCNCLLIDLFTTSNSYSSKIGVSSYTVVYLLRYKLPHFYFKKLATMIWRRVTQLNKLKTAYDERLMSLSLWSYVLFNSLSRVTCLHIIKA